MNYRMVRYDGVLSCDFIICLEDDPSVVSYWEKPGEFRWTDGLRWKRYTPDYAVVLNDNRRIGVEVRPIKSVVKSRFLEKLPFIRRAALANGYDDFELWTEQEIRVQPRLANAALIASSRSFLADEAALHRMRLVIRESGGRGGVRHLRQASGLGNQAFRTIVRLIGLGDLRMVDASIPLDDHAAVEIPSR
jgi:hypothetical protein